MRTCIALAFFCLIISIVSGQTYSKWIDSLILANSAKPFNGIIRITQNEKTIYSKISGYSDIEKKKVLKLNDQFVIGSISKQFTAVLVLREFDKGRLDLHTPIHRYLPDLTQGWADTVTVHHLLTHTHGITQIDRPTMFKAGTQFSYSQIGYDLLAQIVQKTSGKSFAILSKELFKECGMRHTCHPDIKSYPDLVKGYTENEYGKIVYEQESFKNYVAAGSFLSTVEDLNRWNTLFYNGKLLKKETMNLLETKQPGATRDHPIFGTTAYGYGITIDTSEDLLQLGQTGFAPGFVSMSFYFPKTKTSVVVLENIAYDTDDLKKTFYYHTEILKMVRQEIKTSCNH